MKLQRMLLDLYIHLCLVISVRSFLVCVLCILHCTLQWCPLFYRLKPHGAAVPTLHTRRNTRAHATTCAITTPTTTFTTVSTPILPAPASTINMVPQPPCAVAGSPGPFAYCVLQYPLYCPAPATAPPPYCVVVAGGCQVFCPYCVVVAGGCQVFCPYTVTVCCWLQVFCAYAVVVGGCHWEVV